MLACTDVLKKKSTDSDQSNGDQSPQITGMALLSEAMIVCSHWAFCCR